MSIDYEGLPLWISTVKGWKCVPTKSEHECVRFIKNHTTYIVYNSGKGNCPFASDQAQDYTTWLLNKEAESNTVVVSGDGISVVILPGWTHKEIAENILYFLTEDLGLIEPNEITITEESS